MCDAVLLDKRNPQKIIKRLRSPVFEAKADYEMEDGNVPNIVFPSGTVLNGDDLYMYYGAADSSVCLATASLSKILQLFD